MCHAFSISYVNNSLHLYDELVILTFFFNLAGPAFGVWMDISLWSDWWKIISKDHESGYENLWFLCKKNSYCLVGYIFHIFSYVLSSTILSRTYGSSIQYLYLRYISIIWLRYSIFLLKTYCPPKLLFFSGSATGCGLEMPRELKDNLFK